MNYEEEFRRNAFKEIKENPIVLDFTGCKYVDEIHDVIKEAFGFPEYYGKNLSALWDCLDNFCDYELQVCIKGISDLTEEYKEYFSKIWIIFERVHESTPNITFELFS